MKKIIYVLVVLLILSACNKKEVEQQDSDKQTIVDVDYQSEIEETIKEENVIEEEIDDGEIDIDLSELTSIMAYCEVCNIISDLDNNYADNLSSKIGMGYALTGKNDLSIQWEKFHKQIKENIKIGYDYYFLIVNKNNSCDAFWTSLKRIETLIPNGNNLPFQCDWSKNRNFSTRNEIQAIYYILEQYIESWNKKVKGYPFDLKEMLINNNLIC